MKKATLGHVRKILDLIEDLGLGAEEVQSLLHSGDLARCFKDARVLRVGIDYQAGIEHLVEKVLKRGGSVKGKISTLPIVRRENYMATGYLLDCSGFTVQQAIEQVNWESEQCEGGLRMSDPVEFVSFLNAYPDLGTRYPMATVIENCKKVNLFCATEPFGFRQLRILNEKNMPLGSQVLMTNRK